jgi:hypothetical protein
MVEKINVNRKIKLIWDFRGMDAMPTAQHHAIHLKEYQEKTQDTTILECGFETLNEFHHIAFIITYYSEMIRLRDILLPQRAEYAQGVL